MLLGRSWVTERRLNLLRFGALCSGVASVVVMYGIAVTQWSHGGDLALYRRVTDVWIAGGNLYSEHQVSGPYVNDSASLYPPVAAVVMAPLLHLPDVLWWFIPVTVTAVCVLWQRPGIWAVAGMLWCASLLPSVWLVSAGNPALWIMMAVALATKWRSMAAFVVLKPSLFPFALIGMRSYRWWAVILCWAAISVLFLPETIQWSQAVLNARGDRSGLLYSIGDVPLLSIPLIAWIGGRRRPRFDVRIQRASQWILGAVNK